MFEAGSAGAAGRRGRARRGGRPGREASGGRRVSIRGRMPVIEPTHATFAALTALDPDMGPVEMLNLLRYNERAAYPDGTSCSGREAYLRYGAAVLPHLERVGGAVVRRAQAELAFIAPEGETWDELFLVRYPNIGAFLRMIMDPGYQQIAIHRHVALAEARLLITRPIA